MGSSASVQYSLNYNDVPIHGVNSDYYNHTLTTKFSLPTSLFASYCDSDGIIERDNFIRLTKSTDVYLMYDIDGVDDRGRVITERVNIINEYLRNKGLVTWIYTDHDKIGNNALHMRRCIEEGICNTQCVLVFMSKRLLKKINDPADSVHLDLGLLHGNIEVVEEEKRMQEMMSEANVVTIKPRKTIIPSTVAIEKEPISSGTLSKKSFAYIPVDNAQKFEFHHSFKTKSAQLMIPVILEERVQHPQSWGACVEDILGCRLAINCSNFENNAAALASLYDLIIARIKCPLLKGGNFQLDNTKYSVKGRHLHWLKKYTTFDKATRERYADLFIVHGVETVMSFLTPLTYNSTYLVDAFHMPRSHSDAIYQALQQLAYEACSATNQIEVVKSLKKQKDAWELNENAALAGVCRSKSILSHNEEFECMSREDLLSHSLLVESQLYDIKERNSVCEANRVMEEGDSIGKFDEYRIRVRNEKEFINYRESQFHRRKQLVDMAIKVNNIVPAGVYVRVVSEKVARYFAGLPVDKFTFEELKCTRQEVLEDTAAVFIMLNRLMSVEGDFSTFRAELLRAGLLMHMMWLVYNCSRYSDSVQMIKSEEYCDEYCSLPPVITDSNHYVCTAIENGLHCISLACRPSRYSRECINVDNITLIAASGIITVIVTAISSNIHVRSIVHGAVACLSTVTCTSASFGKDVLEPLSGTTSEKSLTPSRAEHVQVVLTLLTCLTQVLQRYADCPDIVSYCAEVIVATVSFDIILELSACRVASEDASVAISGIVIIKKIFKSLIKCCSVMSNYDQNGVEWLLYCLNSFTIIHNVQHQSMQQSRVVNEFVTEYYGRTGLCATIISACPTFTSQQSILELALILLGNLAANNCNNVFLLYDAGAVAVTITIIRDHYLTDVRVASAGYYFLNQLIDNVSGESSDFLQYLQRSIIQLMLESGLCETILFPCTLGGLREMKLRSAGTEEPQKVDLVDMYISSFHVVTSLVKFGDFTIQTRIVSIGICEKIVDVLKCHGRSSRVLFEVCCDSIRAIASVNVALGTQTRLLKCGAPRILYDLWLEYSNEQQSHEKGIEVIYMLSNEADAFDIVKEFTLFGIKAFLNCKRNWSHNTSLTAQYIQKASYVSFLRDMQDVSLNDVHAMKLSVLDQEPFSYKQKLYILYSIVAIPDE